MFYIALNEFDDLDRQAFADGFCGCCDLDCLYTTDDYSCKYFHPRE